METEILVSIDKREPFASGAIFGKVGPYERITGQVLFFIDPDDPRNQTVVDLGNTPRTTAGRVEYSASFALLKPLELRRGNGRLLYDVNNRGNKRALQFFNDAPPSNNPQTSEDAGNGFLMRRGYSIVWSGWEGDLLPVDERMTMQLPAARENGAEISGWVRAEFIVEEPNVLWIPLSGNHYIRPYEATTLNTSTATLTCRRMENDPRQRIPKESWQFAGLSPGGDIIPSAFHCFLPTGFRPGWIYELIYAAKNPLVLGLGFTGVRDLVDFLRYGDRDARGMANPLREGQCGMTKAYAWGRSQSGRFLREFVYRGFNEGLAGEAVFDGVFSHVAGAGRLALNYRFAQPDRYPRQHEDHLFPSDQFPFAYAPARDPFSGRRDSILKRPRTDPVVIHTQTSTEYWQRRGSLVHTDPTGKDLPPHPRARLYCIAGAQHNAPDAPAEGGRPRYRPNPLQVSPILRALLDSLDRWASDGPAPPPNKVPTRAGQTLVTPSAVAQGFAILPWVLCPDQPNRLFVQDYGPDFERGFFSPDIPLEDRSKEYPVMVPFVDRDGNEIAGLRVPPLQVPTGTYTGWNLRGDLAVMAGIMGSFFPFAITEREARQRGDPRPSLAERYRSQTRFLHRLRIACRELAKEGLLLQEDVERYLEKAAAEDLFHLRGL